MERKFKMATGEPIKHFREIKRLLTAIYCPKEVAVMHCKGHSKDGSKVAEGNQLVDCQARKAAFCKIPSQQTPLIWTGPVEQEKPQQTEQELERYEKRGAKITDKGWLQSEDGQLIIPENAQWKSFPKALGLTNYVTQLSAFQQALMELQEVTPDPDSESSKPLLEPGAKVLIKTLGSGGQSLEPLWEGPNYQVILSSPTAVRVAGIDSWVHHTQLRGGTLTRTKRCHFSLYFLCSDFVLFRWA